LTNRTVGGGAHRERGSTTAGALILLLSTVNSTGEADKQQCQVAGEMAVRFILASVARSRGKQKGAHSGFSVEQRGKGGRRKRGPDTACGHAARRREGGVQQGQAATMSGRRAGEQGRTVGSVRGEKRRACGPAWKERNMGPTQYSKELN
jgi:hypothetical protein